MLPLAPGGTFLGLEQAAAAVAAAGLEAQLVADRGRWSSLEGAVAIPWQLPPARRHAMTLIATYRNPGYSALADAVMAFFERRSDLQRPGVAFGPEAGLGGRAPPRCPPTSAWWRLTGVIRRPLPWPR